MVYVLNNHGKALMPCTESRARKLLKTHRATVVKRFPFTIKLTFGSYGRKEHLNLGVDVGSKIIGLSVTSDKRSYLEAEVRQRTDVVSLIATRGDNKHHRRSTKIRHRKARHANRKIPKGTIYPSIVQKIRTHISAIKFIEELLPISSIIVELASFNTSRLSDPSIIYRGYDKGRQFGTHNVREFVLNRDLHTCKICGGSSGDTRLNVHHLESRKTGGNSPGNLITLCETCHHQLHLGKIHLPDAISRTPSLRDAAHMNIMKDKLVSALNESYTNVSITSGIDTKAARESYNLSKTHITDARCISGHPDVAPYTSPLCLYKLRRHNRCLHKIKPSKGGVRLKANMPKLVHGFKLYDIVYFDKKLWYIKGRRSSGAFSIISIDSDRCKRDIRYYKLQLVAHSNGFLIMPL